jgi:outer membrane protein insertion porin family
MKVGDQIQVRSYGQGLAGDPSRHVLVSSEAVLALGGIDRVLLLRGRAAMVERLASAAVPFEELVSPSGSAGMRGFADGRFRGESGLVGTVEYRWYVAHNLDASLFTDLGTVAGPAFTGLRRDRWFPSFGVGLRLFKLTGPHWTAGVDSGLQVAYAPDGGFRVLLSVAPF